MGQAGCDLLRGKDWKRQSYSKPSACLSRIHANPAQKFLHSPSPPAPSTHATTPAYTRDRRTAQSWGITTQVSVSAPSCRRPAASRGTGAPCRWRGTGQHRRAGTHRRGTASCRRKPNPKAPLPGPHAASHRSLRPARRRATPLGDSQGDGDACAQLPREGTRNPVLTRCWARVCRPQSARAEWTRRVSRQHQAALPALPLPARLPPPLQRSPATRSPQTDSHFPMCFNLSLNKASSDTAPPASLVTEGATSPGRQTSGHQERVHGEGKLETNRFHDPIPALAKPQAGRTRVLARQGWLWMRSLCR